MMVKIKKEVHSKLTESVNQLINCVNEKSNPSIYLLEIIRATTTLSYIESSPKPNLEKLAKDILTLDKYLKPLLSD